jgi:excisionase family DNA binding protein
MFETAEARAVPDFKRIASHRMTHRTNAAIQRHEISRRPGMEAPVKGSREPLTVTVDDAVKMIGLGKTTLYKLVGEGRVTSVTVGRRRLVHVSSLRCLVGS